MDESPQLRGAAWRTPRAGYLCERVSRTGKTSAKFWRARSGLYRNEILQENMRLTAFFKVYKMCTLLHRSTLNILVKCHFEKSALKFWNQF